MLIGVSCNTHTLKIIRILFGLLYIVRNKYMTDGEDISILFFFISLRFVFQQCLIVIFITLIQYYFCKLKVWCPTISFFFGPSKSLPEIPLDFLEIYLKIFCNTLEFHSLVFIYCLSSRVSPILFLMRFTLLPHTGLFHINLIFDSPYFTTQCGMKNVCMIWLQTFENIWR